MARCNVCLSVFSKSFTIPKHSLKQQTEIHPTHIPKVSEYCEISINKEKIYIYARMKSNGYSLHISLSVNTRCACTPNDLKKVGKRKEEEKVKQASSRYH